MMLYKGVSEAKQTYIMITKSTLMSTSDAGSINKANDKQKIKVLKDAVLQLREKDQLSQQEVKSLKADLEKTQREKIELEVRSKEQIDDLVQQVKTLSLQLEAQMQPNERQTPTRIQSQSIFSSKIGLSARPHDAHTEEEVQTLKKQLSNIKNEMLIQSNNHETQLSLLRAAYKELDNDFSKKQTQFMKLSKELEEKNQMIEQLKKNFEDVDREYYQRQKQQEATINQLNVKMKALENDLQAKDGEINSLEKKLDEQTFKVVQFQNELEETRGKILQHRLTMKSGMLEIECLLIFRQNIFRQYILEIETAGQQRFVYNALEVSDLKPINENTFTIKIQSQKQREEQFTTTQDVKKVCKSIKHFLQKAQADQSKKAQPIQQGNGLLGGFISLFSSGIQMGNSRQETQSQKSEKH